MADTTCVQVKDKERAGAPEHIWALRSREWGWDSFTSSSRPSNTIPCVEYVRADLFGAARAEVDRLTAALAEAETRGWQPMETAPEYGKHVLVARYLPKEGKWFACVATLERQMTTVPGGWHFPATHWMPLPEPPREEG